LADDPCRLVRQLKEIEWLEYCVVEILLGPLPACPAGERDFAATAGQSDSPAGRAGRGLNGSAFLKFQPDNVSVLPDKPAGAEDAHRTSSDDV